jgi:hypothetical protein
VVDGPRQQHGRDDCQHDRGAKRGPWVQAESRQIDGVSDDRRQRKQRPSQRGGGLGRGQAVIGGRGQVPILPSATAGP